MYESYVENDSLERFEVSLFSKCIRFNLTTLCRIMLSTVNRGTVIFLLCITLIFISLYSYRSLRQRGSMELLLIYIIGTGTYFGTICSCTNVLIDYSIVISRPLCQSLLRKRSSRSCNMIETYNARHHFPCYLPMSSYILNNILGHIQRKLPE